MKKIKLVLKYCIYYAIGLISFSTVAFITQKITISILLKAIIDPIQDWYNLLNYISLYAPYYFLAYTLLYFLIMYSVRKYDKYIVNKLNKKLEEYKNVRVRR